MGPLNLVAHAHAAGAQDAAVVIHHEAFVRSVHGQAGVLIGEVDVRHAQLERQRLQVAVAVHHAHRANVVALGEQQFQNAVAVAVQTLGVGEHFHAFGHARDAGGQQARRALQLDETEAARAHGGKPRQVAESGDEDIVFARDIENGLVFARADLTAVNG